MVFWDHALANSRGFSTRPLSILRRAAGRGGGMARKKKLGVERKDKPDKITRDACACNDDKVIFENPLNWTTRSFIFAKQREYENGPATPEPSGETIVRGRDRGKRKEAELYAPHPGYREGDLL